MQLNPRERGEEALLSYDNLKDIIDIYNNCPSFLKYDKY